MDSTSETQTQVTSNMSPNRPFSRVSVLAVLLGSCVVGVGVLAMIQSRSQAQSGYAQSVNYDQSFVDQSSSRTRVLPNLPFNQLANEVPPDGYASPQPASYASTPPASNTSLSQKADTRWVREERVVYETDPKTGAVVARPIVTVRPAHGQEAEPQNNSVHAAETDINQLAVQYRNASPADREVIMQALTKKLSDVFDARHQEQSVRAEKLRAELKETQDLLEKRTQLKSKIVERRAKELTGLQDELSWNPQASKPSPALTGPMYSGNVPPSYGPQAYGTSPSPGFSSETILPRSTLLPSPGEEMPLRDNNVQSSIFSPANDTPSYTRPVGDNTSPNPAVSYQPVASGTLPNLPMQVSPIPSADLKPSSQVPFSSEQQLSAPSQAIDTPVMPIPSASPNETTSSAESQRSYMSVGFKLKKLIRDLEAKKETLGKDHPAFKASGLESAIEDTKTTWDYERQTLRTELESIESELTIVKQKRELVAEKRMRQKQLVAQGAANSDSTKEADVDVLNADREVLQVQFRLKSIENAIDWMNKFEEKYLAAKPLPAT